MTGDLAAKAQLLRSLHVPGRPLVLPNAWDAASARAVVEAGFPAVATSSEAVAESLGFEDGEAAPAGEMLAAIARIAGAVPVPVSADIEAGYGIPPAEMVERLLATGAVGCNLEDSDHAGSGLVDAGALADRIAAMVAAAMAAGVPIVINARVDVFIREVGPSEGRLDEVLRRARRYLGAGAACVYPIWVADEPTIAALVDGCPGPVNMYARPEAPGLGRLAELGVARVSFGPLIHRLAIREVRQAVARIREGERPF